MVRRKDDGRWEGRIVEGHKDNSDSIFRYIYAPTQKELTRKLRQEISAYQGVDLTEDSKLPLGQWLDFWYQAYKKPTLRPNTQMSYEQRIYGYIIPALGDIPLEKLTQNDLQQFYTDLKQHSRRKDADHYGEGLSDATVRGCYTTSGAALDKAVYRAEPGAGGIPV